MFAIVEVASRQHKITAGDTLDIPRIEKKKEVLLDKVLMTISGKDVNIGTPYVKGVKVVCDIVGDIKGEKKYSFKFKKRKSYHRNIGHRDLLTRVKVKEVKTT
ncbi:MAG: 50S ribosomal protein L21 [Candidatus Omnitrophica bacterium]|nr:50S ribosomal protein L21 [Candidatus Omnitrophota bacterium]